LRVTKTRHADFWVQIIRGNHDRYRTGLTNAAVFDAIGPASGLRILDAGCGEGYMARELAAQGADVLGVDSSPSLIEAASALTSGSGETSPRFHVNDVADLDAESSSYDLVLCNHLMNDLADPRGPIREFARVLKPGGRIVIMMLHPCFYSDRTARANGSNQGIATTYFTQRRVTQRFNVDGITSPAEVTSWHRPLEFYAQALADADLSLADLREPHPTREQLESDPWWRANFPRPLFLLLVARKHS
jgi:ubiquinone/menaquinone biosynthesis C-methylase UbiE